MLAKFEVIEKLDLLRYKFVFSIAGGQTKRKSDLAMTILLGPLPWARRHVSLKEVEINLDAPSEARKLWRDNDSNRRGGVLPFEATCTVRISKPYRTW